MDDGDGEGVNMENRQQGLGAESAVLSYGQYRHAHNRNREAGWPGQAREENVELASAVALHGPRNKAKWHDAETC